MLVESVRQSNDIKEIDMAPYGFNREAEISQYADDTSVFLHDENQIIPTIDTIASFSSVSGLALNIDKTEAMWLGTFRDRKEKLFGFKWPQTIRFLGIYVGYGTEETLRWNWTNKLETFPKTLDCWRTRDLTFLAESS